MFGKRLARALALTVTASFVLTAVALADNVENDVQSTYGGENVPYAAGSPAVSVDFWITANSAGGLPGCDAGDGSTATVHLSVPADVIASATSLVFTTCDTPQAVAFSTLSTATPGQKTVSVSSVTDSRGAYNVGQASFKLNVSAPAETNEAPVVTAASFVASTISCNSATAISVTFTDDSTSSSWTYSVDWENDGTFDDVGLATGLSSPGTFSTSSHTYPLPGSYTAAVKVKDNQGLESTAFLTTNSLTVNQTYEVVFLKPVDGMVMGQTPEIVNSGKLGRVWPVKVTIFDNCGDTGWVDDPAAPPTISLLKSGTGTNVLTDSLEQYSAGSSNSGLYFRWTSDTSFAAGGYWIFNLDSANPPGGWTLDKGSVYRVDVFVGSTKATGSTATSQFAKIKPV